MWPKKQGCSHHGLGVLHIFLSCIEPYSKLDSQSYGFSSSYVWIWELDHKEGWGLKNWCFGTVVLEKTIQSPLNCKKIKPVNLKGNQPWIFIGRTDAEAPKLWPCEELALMWRANSLEKTLNAEKDWGQEEKGMTKDEIVGWHHWLNGHEFEQVPGDGGGQGSLACCSPLSKSWTWLRDWTTMGESDATLTPPHFCFQ